MKVSDYSKFDSFARKYDEFCSTFEGNPWLGWDNLTGNHALDIGCGSGLTTSFIAKKYKNVVGIDLCSELIQVAKDKHGDNNVEYIVCDLFEYSSDKKYDYVYSHTMMHHISDYEYGLERIKTFVKEGGKLVIIDNVCDQYRTPPTWTYTFSAIINFFPNIIKFGFKKALTILIFWNNKEWLKHLASDKYLNRNEFKKMYSEVFPGGEIIDLGYANAIKWTNE